ncbi:MAG TPA: NAD-dependent protein deacylase [Myxococcota bacterium]|nr:NAD-dependent protein deacylase [Myxococcota bacterium]
MTDLPDTTLALSSSLDAEIRHAAETLVRARRAVALTGAGLSVESGIPPFRGPGGIWTRYGEPPMDGYQRFLRDPAEAWRERLSPREDWMRALAEAVRDAKPNPGHLALAELERRGHLAALITQNIDDLHRQAGHVRVLEIHGNHRLLRCLDCSARYEPAAIAVDPDHLPPRCPRCAGVVKGDIVVFGEPIPADVLRGCFQAVASADCMLVAGTSATVYPAAEFPYEVLRAGGVVIEVNPDESELTQAATISLRGPGGPVLTRLLEHAAALAVPEAG